MQLEENSYPVHFFEGNCEKVCQRSLIMTAMCPQNSSFHSVYERFETSHAENSLANRTLVRRAVLFFFKLCRKVTSKKLQSTRKQFRQFFSRFFEIERFEIL